MPTEPDLAIHDVKISEAASLGLTGAVTRVTTVVWYVGPHGPFIAQFLAAEFTAEKARSTMDAKAAELRTLLTSIPG